MPAPSRPARPSRPVASFRCLRPLRRRVLPGLLLAGALGGCGGGGGDGGTPATALPAEREVGAVRDFMLDRYYWRDLIPASADLAGAAGAADALERLRARPIDRFSAVEPLAPALALLDAGRATGLGIGFQTRPDRLALRFVQPASPAAAAGLARGDAIVAVDGVALAALPDDAARAAALGPNRAGLTVRLRVERAGTQREVTVTKADYATAPVQADRVIDDGGRRVGYVYLGGFTEPARQDWNAAIARLRAGGARDLVIDLRHNTGGRLGVATAVASAIAPPQAVGQPFARLVNNAANRFRDQDLRFEPAVDGPFLPARVVALASGTTCSAAEALVFGLRPFVPVTLVGETTCGKPVGFSPQPVGDKLLNAVTFAIGNRDAIGDYFGGLPVTCAATDDLQRPFGDPADPLLRTALAWLRDGGCPAVAGTRGVDTKSASTPFVSRGIVEDAGLR